MGASFGVGIAEGRQRLPEQDAPPIRATAGLFQRGGATITWPSPRRRSATCATSATTFRLPTLLADIRRTGLGPASPGTKTRSRHPSGRRTRRPGRAPPPRRRARPTTSPAPRRCGSRPPVPALPSTPALWASASKRASTLAVGVPLPPMRATANAGDTLTAAMLSYSAGLPPKPPRRPDARRAPRHRLHADDHLGRRTLDRTDQLHACGSVTSPASPEPTMRSSAPSPP